MIIRKTCAIKHGDFANRQHLLNHIDMILGLSSGEINKENRNRLLVMLDNENHSLQPMNTTSLSDYDIINSRTAIVKKSIFALGWEQIILRCGNHFIRSTDIKNEDDCKEVLQNCLDIWIKKDKSASAFYDKTSVIVALLGWEIVAVDRIIVRKIPTENEIKKLPIPINNRRVLSSVYSSDESWKIFSERICKNEFVKMYLEGFQDKKCAICHKDLNKYSILHHTDYDHKCALYNSGLNWRLPGTRVQPNCELCYNVNKDWFDECVSRLKIVHNSCNHTIEDLSYAFSKDGVQAHSMNLKKTDAKTVNEQHTVLCANKSIHNVCHSINDFHIGDTIRHRTFGLGTVQEIIAADNQPLVRIKFDDGREHNFVISSAPIIIINHQ